MLTTAVVFPYETSGPVTVHRIRLNRKRTGIVRYLFEYGLFFCQAAVKVSFLHFRRQYRFVQVNSMPDFLVFAATVPKLLGAKLVLDLHEPAPELFSTLSATTIRRFSAWSPSASRSASGLPTPS